MGGERRFHSVRGIPNRLEDTAATRLRGILQDVVVTSKGNGYGLAELVNP